MLSELITVDIGCAQFDSLLDAVELALEDLHLRLHTQVELVESSDGIALGRSAHVFISFYYLWKFIVVVARIYLRD